jgi:hypothetical protein
MALECGIDPSLVINTAPLSETYMSDIRALSLLSIMGLKHEFRRCPEMYSQHFKLKRHSSIR